MAERKRAALYLRVSTEDQTTENQRLALRQEAERRGWTIASEYEDAGISGARKRDKRPGLDNLLKDAVRGRFDVVMCWALDRLGRSLADLMSTLQELDGANVDLYLHQQAIDTTTPAGRLFFHITGAVAEFERGMLVARVKAGQARARKEGKRIGRPKLPYEVTQKIRIALGRGQGITKTARELGVGTATVANIKRNMSIARRPTASMKRPTASA